MRCRPEWCGGEEVSICGAGWSCGSSMGSCRLIPPAEWHPSPASFTLPCWWHPLCAHASGYQRNKLEALWMKVQGSRSCLTKSAHYSWRNCSMYISSLFWRSLSYEKETWMMLLQKLLAKQWSLLFSPVAKSGLAACCFWGCTDLIQERLSFTIMSCFSACETAPSMHWGDLPTVGQKHMWALKRSFNFSLCRSLSGNDFCIFILYLFRVQS